MAKIVTVTATGVRYTQPRESERVLLTAAAAKMHGKAKNVRALAKDAPERADGFTAVLTRKATPRRVKIDGPTVLSDSNGGSAVAREGYIVTAAQAASLASLTADETAAFLARFDPNGRVIDSTPADPTLTATAFRKVNALAGKTLSWTLSARESETLS